MISVYPNGVFFHRQGFCYPSKVSGQVGGLRGEIKSFSFASRLRMRRFLLSYHVPALLRCGVTLTLPCRISMDSFREVIHRFRNQFVRRFPLSGCVYRVELQQNGMPHLHLISWHREIELSFLSGEYSYLWLSALSVTSFSFEDFINHGVRIDFDLNVPATIRYICDHSTKSKQAQLGFIGKQWGVLGRSNFFPVFPSDLDLSDSDLLFLSRFLRRLNRFTVPCDCPFGCRKSRKMRSCRAVNYVSSDTVLRLFPRGNKS